MNLQESARICKDLQESGIKNMIEYARPGKESGKNLQESAKNLPGCMQDIYEYARICRKLEESIRIC